MSRDGGEHREDQAAEDQDEPEQKHKTGVKQDDINGLTSSTPLTKPSFPLVPNRLCTEVELFLCDKLLNPFWQWRKSSTPTTWQRNRTIISCLQWTVSPTIIQFPEISS